MDTSSGSEAVQQSSCVGGAEDPPGSEGVGEPLLSTGPLVSYWGLILVKFASSGPIVCGREGGGVTNVGENGGGRSCGWEEGGGRGNVGEDVGGRGIGGEEGVGGSRKKLDLGNPRSRWDSILYIASDVGSLLAIHSKYYDFKFCNFPFMCQQLFLRKILSRPVQCSLGSVYNYCLNLSCDCWSS